MENFTQEEARIDLIERFLTDALSPNEIAEVQKRITEDAAFAKEVEKYRFLLDGFRTMEAEQLRQNMQSWPIDVQTTSTRKLTSKWSLAIAASVVLLIGLAITLRWLAPSKQSPAELYAMSITDFESELTVRSDRAVDDSLMVLLMDGLGYYEMGQYEAAIHMLEDWTAQTQSHEISDMFYANAQLCLAVSLLRTDQSEAAAKTLEAIPENSSYVAHARWYRGLAHLQLGEGEAARQQLEKLLDDRYYGDRVRKLLQQL